MTKDAVKLNSERGMRSFESGLSELLAALIWRKVPQNFTSITKG